jgi:hypothetical protein
MHIIPTGILRRADGKKNHYKVGVQLRRSGSASPCDVEFVPYQIQHQSTGTIQNQVWAGVGPKNCPAAVHFTLASQDHP